MESRAAHIFRELLAKAPALMRNDKGKATEFKPSLPLPENLGDTAVDDNEWEPLKIPLSFEAKAHVRELEHSKLTPKDLIGLEDSYTALTMAIIDWLRQTGGNIGIQLMEDPMLSQEVEIKALANVVAEKNVDVPAEMERCWEEAQGMRRRVIRYHDARLEDWDETRRNRTDRMRRFLGVLGDAYQRILDGPKARPEMTEETDV